MNIEEVIDLLSGDPLRQYRDTIQSLLEDNKKKIIKYNSRLRVGEKNRMSEKERVALKRIRKRALDNIIQFARFIEEEEKEEFWNELRHS